MHEPLIRLRSKRNYLRKAWNIFLWWLMIAGFPLLAWAGYSLTSEAYAIRGKVMASLVLVMFVFLIIKGPSAFLELIRSRRAIFNLR